MPKILTVPLILAVLIAAVSAQGATYHASGTTASADGVTIAYEIRGAGTKAVVFVHGWSCDQSYWQDQVEHFATAFKVVTIDLAGHGESGMGRTDYTMAAFGADVAAVLRHLGITDAVLVGHSMGGPVIVEAAIQSADRVGGLIGIDNFQDVNETISEEQIEAWLANFAGDFPGTVETWVRSMFPKDADPDLVEEVAKDMASAPPEVGLSALRHTLSWWGGPGTKQLERIFINLVCVNADLWPTNIESNREVLPGFKAWIMPKTGHFLMREKPAAFNALLAEALADFGFVMSGNPGPPGIPNRPSRVE